MKLDLGFMCNWGNEMQLVGYYPKGAVEYLSIYVGPLIFPWISHTLLNIHL